MGERVGFGQAEAKEARVLAGACGRKVEQSILRSRGVNQKKFARATFHLP
jgi:hypothetical protein